MEIGILAISLFCLAKYQLFSYNFKEAADIIWRQSRNEIGLGWRCQQGGNWKMEQIIRAAVRMDRWQMEYTNKAAKCLKGPKLKREDYALNT